MKVEKETVVLLGYETHVDGKIIDSSEIHKPIEIAYGFTSISSEMDKKIKGQEKGFKFELRQTIDSNPMDLEFEISSFDDDTQELMKNNEEVELEMKGTWYPFEVTKFDPTNNIVHLRYEDPFAGKKVLHKLEILNVKPLPLSEKHGAEKSDKEE